MHTYIHACMHTYIHPCIHTSMHACMHACIHTYIYIYIIHILLDWLIDWLIDRLIGKRSLQPPETKDLKKCKKPVRRKPRPKHTKHSQTLVLLSGWSWSRELPVKSRIDGFMIQIKQPQVLGDILPSVKARRCCLLTRLGKPLPNFISFYHPRWDNGKPAEIRKGWEPSAPQSFHSMMRYHNVFRRKLTSNLGGTSDFHLTCGPISNAPASGKTLRPAV